MVKLKIINNYNTIITTNADDDDIDDDDDITLILLVNICSKAFSFVTTGMPKVSLARIPVLHLHFCRFV